MPDYHGNSHKSKEGGEEKARPERPKIEKITNAEIVKRKRGPFRTLKHIIIEMDMRSVGNLLLHNTIIPMFKNMIVFTGEQALHQTVYGQGRAGGWRPPSPSPSQVLGIGRERERGGVVNYVPYSDMTSPSRFPVDPRVAPQLAIPSVVVDNSGYRIRSKDLAEETLRTMAYVIDRWEVVTVADLHDMLDLPSTPIENQWGWIDVREARIRQTRDGWLLDLPEPEPLPA
jgi:hypothetical protein